MKQTARVAFVPPVIQVSGLVSDRSISVLTALLVFCVPLPSLLWLPVFNAKLQPPEFIFPVLIVLALFSGRFLIRLPRPRFLWVALLFYLIVISMSAIRVNDVGGWLEAVGRCYLVFLAFYISAYVRLTGQRGLQFLMHSWLIGGVALAAAAYYGLGTAYLGYSIKWVHLHEDYPYLGTIYRASGLSKSPTHIVILGILPTCYAWLRWRGGYGIVYMWWLLFVVPVLFLSFSKELLLLAMALFLADNRGLSGQTLLRWLVASGGTLAFWLGTHFMVQPAGDLVGTYLDRSQHFSGKVYWSGGGIQVLESAYLTIKRAMWRVFTEHPWLGVGPDQFSFQLPAQKAAGLFPRYFPDYQPHSTWFGALAEGGIIAFTALVGATLSLWREIRAQAVNWGRNAEVRSLVAYLFVFFVAAMSMDTFHLRYLWVPLGMLLGVYACPVNVEKS